jgi:hypothetical protein
MEEQGLLDLVIHPRRPCVLTGATEVDDENATGSQEDVNRDQARKIIEQACEEIVQEGAQKKGSQGCLILLILAVIIGFVIWIVSSAPSNPPPAPAPTPVVQPPPQPGTPPRPATQPAIPRQLPEVPGTTIGASSEKLMDRFLETRAQILSETFRGTMTERMGFNFEQTLTKSLENKEPLAPARFAYYALLKYARRADPLYSFRARDPSHPLNALGEMLIPRESPVGRAFLYAVKKEDAQFFGDGPDIQPQDVYRWWQANAAAYAAYTPLNTWLRSNWTQKNVMPKLQVTNRNLP